MEFLTTPFQKKVDKPWGYEIIYTPEGLFYTGKILFIKAGKRLSLQYHDQKLETLCLFSGQAIVWLENEQGDIEKIPMEMQKGYSISLNQKHTVEVVTDCFIIEASEAEKGTTVRVADDYARPDETEELRKQPNRGWTE